MKKWRLEQKDGQWQATSGGRAVEGTRSRKKVVAVKKTAAKARRSPDPVSVNIRKADGKFQEERTYPRKADPRRSKG